MSNSFVSFDDIRRRVEDMVATLKPGTALDGVDGVDRIYLVRDLLGRLRISVSDTLEENEHVCAALDRLAKDLSSNLGVHGYPSDEGVLFVDDTLLKTLEDTAREIGPRVFLADRLVTGRGWWTVGDAEEATRTRITLYSAKGGVGRSTTAAVLAWHLARKGERVLAVDMDLESPGLSSVLLESRNGLHDIAAASVTDLKAEVLLFATDSESTWTDYGILFRHWRERGLAKDIRERVSVVSALTPVSDREEYFKKFRAQAWDLFRDHLYDEMDGVGDSVGDFSFDLDEENAPHNPMEIAWALGLAAGTSLQDLDEETVNSAYGRFLKSFDERVGVSGEGSES